MSLSPAGRRAKGHAFERLVAEHWREMGWEDCMTTREAKGGNWAFSDDGIDLCNTEPFAAQLKRGKTYAHISKIEEVLVSDGEGGMTPASLFRDCPTIPILISKADNKPTMAALPWEDLRKLIRDYYRKTP